MKLLVLLLLLFSLSGVEAEEEHSIPLLAVVESEGENKQGVVAHLLLEVQPGTGQVFIGTSSFAAIDTQITTKQAKEIACEFLEQTCDVYDFFYTIQTNSQIVKGPSAGVATAILTIATIEKVEVKEGIAITGTILSGGIIGNVGGLPEKVKLAADNHKSKVLIPYGRLDETIEGNNITLREYGNQLGIEIIEVSVLSEAVAIMLDLPEEKVLAIEESARYKENIELIAQNLCRVAEENRGQQEADELLDKAKTFSDNTYAQASYCFNANVINTNEELNKKTSQELNELTEELKIIFDEFEQELKLPSRDDVAIYGVVKERIEQGKNGVTRAQQFLEEGELRAAAQTLALSKERVKSVMEWSRFLEKEQAVAQEILQPLCRKKTGELSELLQYVDVLSEGNNLDISGALRRVQEQERKGDYAACIYFATDEKAQANYVLTRLNSFGENRNNTVEAKLQRAEQVIATQDNFPIVAYTFLQYAEALYQDNDTESALLFAEQALAFATLNNEIQLLEEQEQKAYLNYFLVIVLSIALLILVVITTIQHIKIRKTRKHLMRKNPRRTQKRSQGLKR